MRILHVIESLGRGGAEKALLNLLPALQKRGHQCEVAALWPSYDMAPHFIEADIRVHCLDLNHRWNLWQGIARLSNILAKGNFDIAHSHLYFAGIYNALSVFNGTGKVASFHNLGYDSYPANNLWKFLRKQLEGCLMRHFMDGHSAVSMASKRHYTEHLRINEIAVVPNAVQLTELNAAIRQDSALIRAKHGLSVNEFILVMPGRLVPEKGHRILLQALIQLRRENCSPRLLIIGEGRLRRNIESQIQQHGLQEQVRMFGALSHEDLFSLMHASDAVVIPSIHEGWGLAAAEAMALGKPVIATQTGGLVELVEHGGSGLLVPSGDATALATEINRVISNATLRDQLGCAASEAINTHYGADVVAAQTELFYQKVLIAKSDHLVPARRPEVEVETIC